MRNPSRAIDLLLRAIRTVEDQDELAKLRATCREFYAGDDTTFAALTREIDARGSALSLRSEQSELFPVDTRE